MLVDIFLCVGGYLKERVCVGGYSFEMLYEKKIINLISELKGYK